MLMNRAILLNKLRGDFDYEVQVIYNNCIIYTEPLIEWLARLNHAFNEIKGEVKWELRNLNTWAWDLENAF